MAPFNPERGHGDVIQIPQEEYERILAEEKARIRAEGPKNSEKPAREKETENIRGELGEEPTLPGQSPEAIAAMLKKLQEKEGKQ